MRIPFSRSRTISLLVLASMCLPVSAEVPPVRKFDIDQIPTVRGVGLGSTKTSAMEALGVPQAVRAEFNDGFIVGYGARTFYDYSGLTVLFEENNGCDSALTLFVSEPRWVLNVGINVGSSESEVLEKLGNGHPLTEPKELFERWYNFPTKNDYAKLILTFDRQGGRVVLIRIDGNFD